MAKPLSPLRYPGGKFKIYSKVKNLIETNGLREMTYVEPFAGGFGIGLSLLAENVVKTAVLNDIDTHIYNFWFAVLNHTDEFVRLVTDVPVTMEERERQKAIYMSEDVDPLSDGFATFFLNRVNFSGVITGGPIGGYSQNGAYKLDCRFNKGELIKRIEQVASLRERIELFNLDAGELICRQLRESIHRCFFNIDPPYVKKGHRLYTSYFEEEDHRNLERKIAEYLGNTTWIVTYDDCDLIRDIYSDYHIVEYDILHNAGGSVRGKEIVITNIPKNLFSW
ncbi:MAG: DNA adenine methylase [Firmicutes bacterium]|nr:DNA adenine methylase [Bacillota bacterium]